MDDTNSLKTSISIESIQSEVNGEENISVNFDEKITIEVDNSKNCRGILEKIANNKQFHDVTLVAGENGLKIPANRSVLSGANDYFCAMFTDEMKEKNQKEVPILEINGKTLKLLIDYCYGSAIEITSENLVDLLAAASMLNFVEIEKSCKQFLAKQLRSKRELWTKIYQFAEKYSFTDLMESSIRVACEDFQSIRETADFLNLEYSCLERILKSNFLSDVSEQYIFETAMDWVNYLDERKQFIPHVLKMIRLVRIDETYLVDKISPICIENNCSDLLIEVLQWHVLPDPRKVDYLPLEQTAKRTKVLIMTAIGGDIEDDSISVESYCFQSKKWTVFWKINLPNAKLERHFAVNDTVGYIVNGFCGNLSPYVASDTVYRFDLNKREIVSIVPMSTKRAYQNIAIIDGTLYVVGGFNNTYLKTMESFNPKTNKWTTCAEMNYARSHFGSTVLNGILYVIGGYSTIGYLEQVEFYDPAQNVWQTTSSMNVQRANPGVGVLNDKIYAVGGENNGDHLPSVEMYDPATSKWTYVASLNTPRSGIAVAVYENQVFAIGGITGSSRTTLIERFDEKESKWMHIESLQRPRFKCGVTIH